MAGPNGESVSDGVVVVDGRTSASVRGIGKEYDVQDYTMAAIIRARMGRCQLKMQQKLSIIGSCTYRTFLKQDESHINEGFPHARYRKTANRTENHIQGL